MKPNIVKPLIAAIAVMLCSTTAVAVTGDIFMRTMSDGSIELSNVPVDDDFNLLMAAPVIAGTVIADIALPPGPPGEMRGLPLLVRVAQYRQLVAAAAKAADVDVRLLHAVIAVESAYNSQAVSPKGALGLMQLMPDTARRYGVANARDPAQNIHAGARYLRDLLKLFNNDVQLALAAYNAGENAVIRHGRRIPPYRETTAYVPKVLAVYRKLEPLVI